MPLMCKPQIRKHSTATPGEEGAIWAVHHGGFTDPLLLLYAASKLGVQPRLMGSANFFKFPVIGSLLRAAGHIPIAFAEQNSAQVDLSQTDVKAVLYTAIEAVRAGETLAGYPAARITRRPGLAPERVRSGFPRVAAASGATVYPLSSLGAHDVVSYDQNFRAAAKKAVRNLATGRRPRALIYFGEPIRQPGGNFQAVARQLEDAMVRDHDFVVRKNPALARSSDASRPIDNSRAIRRP
ncbi:MAG: hypothetical protein HOQ05_03320 [Corynebacteriales bacterium]|nr:hypothetical protein [Mycobacteriales bacterium]